MKNLIKAGLFFSILGISVPAAADVDGTWTGSMATPNGNVEVNYTFMEDGTTLTGSSAGPDGSEIAISNGRIDGENISFTITVDFQGMPMTMGYTGVVMGDTIDFNIDISGMAFPLTVTRDEDV